MKIIKSDKGNYSVRYKDRGGSWRSTNLNTKSKKEADSLVIKLKIEDIEQAAKLDILSAEVLNKITSGTNIKYSQVVKEYIEHMRLSAGSENSIYTMTSVYEQFDKIYKVNDKPINMIKEKDIYNFLNADDGTSISNRSLRKSTLRQLFDYALIKMYTLSNPLNHIKVDKSKLSHDQKTPKEKDIFYKREVDKLITHAPYFFKQAIALSYWCGLRLGDICNLEWASIKDRNRILIHTLKRDKLVSIDTTDEKFGGGILKKVLQEIDVEDKKYCFPVWQKVNADPKNRSKTSVYFTRYCERMEIAGKSFHCLRHSCITRLNKLGLSLEEIGVVVGHSSTKTTEGYVHK